MENAALFSERGVKPQVSRFFFWGHTRLTPESSRYPPKGFRRTSTSTALDIQAPTSAAATATGTADFSVGLSR